MIDIVIVNWNSGEQLRDVVLSIAREHAGLVSQVVLVDNNSADQSLALAEDAGRGLPFAVRVVRNSSNLGFGAACNQGAHYGQGEFVLFLNPDARLFANSLPVPLNYLRDPANASTAICGIQLLEHEGSVARSCSRFPSVSSFACEALGLTRIPRLRYLGNAMAEWSHRDSREVDQVIGAFFFMRRAIFSALGGFDERFFVYFEEVDLSYRARQAGWRTVYLAEAQAFHAGGGTSSQVKAARLFYSLRSRLLYGFKHLSPARAWALMGITLVVEPLSRSVFFFLKGQLADVRETARGYGMLLRVLPMIMRTRSR
jgi:GT2 family glycosyltransferase